MTAQISNNSPQSAEAVRLLLNSTTDSLLAVLARLEVERAQHKALTAELAQMRLQAHGGQAQHHAQKPSTSEALDDADSVPSASQSYDSAVGDKAVSVARAAAGIVTVSMVNANGSKASGHVHGHVAAPDGQRPCETCSAGLRRCSIGVCTGDGAE